MTRKNRCACGGEKQVPAKRCRTCSDALRGTYPARSIQLTRKGWQLVGYSVDLILFNAPCVRCHAPVQRRLSGAYDSEGRHVCALVAAA